MEKKNKKREGIKKEEGKEGKRMRQSKDKYTKTTNKNKFGGKISNLRFDKIYYQKTQ